MHDSDVKSSVQLTSSGRLQGFIAGSAANLGSIRIKSIQAQSSAAYAEIKIYNNTSATGPILIHLKFGSAANESLAFDFDGDGVRFPDQAFVSLANCDHFVAYYC